MAVVAGTTRGSSGGGGGGGLDPEHRRRSQDRPPTPSAPAAPSPTPGAAPPSVPTAPTPPPLPGGGGDGGDGGDGGGGGGGGYYPQAGAGAAPLPGAAQAFGPFGSFDAWQSQFYAEHGRAPNQQDVYDAIDSFNFLSMTGRAPTEREWRNRYYTGTWFGGGGGWGGGWGGGGGGGGYAQQPQMWNPGMYFWNIR